MVTYKILLGETLGFNHKFDIFPNSPFDFWVLFLTSNIMSLRYSSYSLFHPSLPNPSYTNSQDCIILIATLRTAVWTSFLNRCYFISLNSYTYKIFYLWLMYYILLYAKYLILTKILCNFNNILLLEYDAIGNVYSPYKWDTCHKGDFEARKINKLVLVYRS